MPSCPNCAAELTVEGGNPGDQAQCPECSTSLTLLAGGEVQLTPPPPVVRKRTAVPPSKAYNWGQTYAMLTGGSDLLMVCLVGFAIFLLGTGFTSLTTATDGVGTIAAAGVISILARLAQASSHYHVTKSMLREIGRTIASAPPR